jgi:hypothetical protein
MIKILNFIYFLENPEASGQYSNLRQSYKDNSKESSLFVGQGKSITNFSGQSIRA